MFHIVICMLISSGKEKLEMVRVVGSTDAYNWG